MDYPYDIQDLTSKIGISKQAIYAFFKKNQAFINENSIKEKANNQKTKPKTKYNQSVLDLLLAHYKGEHGGEARPVKASASPLPVEEAETRSPAAEADTPTIDTVKALQAKIDALQAKLEAAEAERRDLISQNSNLLLLLNQEKAEKQLLLPPPKKTFGERLKELFHK